MYERFLGYTPRTLAPHFVGALGRTTACVCVENWYDPLEGFENKAHDVWPGRGLALIWKDFDDMVAHLLAEEGIVGPLDQYVGIGMWRISESADFSDREYLKWFGEPVLITELPANHIGFDVADDGFYSANTRWEWPYPQTEHLLFESFADAMACRDEITRDNVGHVYDVFSMRMIGPLASTLFSS